MLKLHKSKKVQKQKGPKSTAKQYRQVEALLQKKMPFVGMRIDGVPLLMHCPRCGQHHSDLEEHQFKRPVEAGQRWDRWTICPKTNEPILLG